MTNTYITSQTIEKRHDSLPRSVRHASEHGQPRRRRMTRRSSDNESSQRRRCNETALPPKKRRDRNSQLRENAFPVVGRDVFRSCRPGTFSDRQPVGKGPYAPSIDERCVRSRPRAREGAHAQSIPPGKRTRFSSYAARTPSLEEPQRRPAFPALPGLRTTPGVPGEQPQGSMDEQPSPRLRRPAHGKAAPHRPQPESPEKGRKKKKERERERKERKERIRDRTPEERRRMRKARLPMPARQRQKSPNAARRLRPLPTGHAGIFKRRKAPKQEPF